MKISVAICTWNREGLLKKTLEQFCQLFIPDNVEWELIIINNNCTDNTNAVIELFKPHLPIKFFFEAEPGLSNARNKAIDMASGDYILWTDDDVLVNEMWLSAYVDAFRRHPNAALFGGPISPWFEGTPPKWLKHNWHLMQAAYAIRNLGKEEFKFESTDTSRYPFGANFAVKKIVQTRFKYDPNLGLKSRENNSRRRNSCNSSYLDPW